MTIFKIIMDIISLNLAIACLAFRILHNEDMIGIIYSSVYLALSLADGINCVILMRKLVAY